MASLVRSPPIHPQSPRVVLTPLPSPGCFRGCTTPKVITNLKGDFDVADELDGFEDLKEEDQERIRTAYTEGKGECACRERGLASGGERGAGQGDDETDRGEFMSS